ncbi:hypothetical protein [Marinoscillum sp.]|uniref:hypothetical protein n=1 Tax=Marinoscillum sp. TaxID=2024838 RepID=UPI003BA8BF12
MASPLFTYASYLNYRLKAVNAHGLHSPFLFELYNFVFHHWDDQESQRLKQLRNIDNPNEILKYTDPRYLEDITTSVGRIARRVTSTHKFSYLLYKLINHLRYERVLEVGTSLGINAAYLGSSKAQRVWTMEGVEEIADLAIKRLKKLEYDHVRVVKGLVEHTFRDSLTLNPELIFIDADHRSEAIFWYLRIIKEMNVPVQCIVIHDIYWSRDMNKAWKQIVADDRYSLTIDLFQAGIIFPNHPMEKQHFVVKF